MHYRYGNSMGIGASGLHSPLLSVTGMGAAAQPTFDLNAKLAQMQADFAKNNPKIASGVQQADKLYGQIKQSGGDTTALLMTVGGATMTVAPWVGGALIATAQVMQHYDDWAGSMKAEDAFPKAANTYIDLGWDIARDLGCGSRTNKTREGWRIYFRLGELVAKTNPKVKPYGWEYAGPRDNDPNTDEGRSFRKSNGSDTSAKGIESRWEASWYEEVATAGYATGRAGRRLNILRSCTETLARIKYGLSHLPTEQQRRGVLAGCLQKGVGSRSLNGMEFLGAPLPVPAEFVALMDAPYGVVSVLENRNVPTPTPSYTPYVPPTRTPAPSSGGGGGGNLVALAAAGVGAYLLFKG